MHPMFLTRWRWLQRLVTGACLLYGIASIVLWILVWKTGDRWWPTTVFLFGPRWVAALPLIPLVPSAWLLCRRCLWILLFSAWVILFPVMGLCVPWRLAIPRIGKGPCLRVVSCNLHGRNAGALAALLAAMVPEPDVVVVQEWSQQPQSPPLGGKGWHCVNNGELFLASRYPVRSVETLTAMPAPGTAVCCELDTPYGPVHFVNLRLASPHQQLESVRWRSLSAPAEMRANSELRLTQLQIVSGYAADLGPTTLLAGDFNTPEGSGHLRHCCVRFSNAFSAAGWGFGHTYFTRRVSTRIDHILAGGAWRCRRCWVGPDVGSPHRPLIADVELIRHDR